MIVRVYFQGRPGGALEGVCRRIFECHSGKPDSSGTFLPTGERDVAYDVPDDQVDECRRILAIAGFVFGSKSAA